MTVGPPPPGDPWAALGLPGTATVAEAERAYRRLAKHHHPDAAGDDPARRADAEQRMVELNAAIAAVRAGSPAAEVGTGWWRGSPPGDDADWFGFPLRDDPDAGPAPGPTSCPACGAPMGRLDDLAAHLRTAHGRRRGRRRGPSLVDRLDTLAWRTPIVFVSVLVGLTGLVLALWLRDVLPADAEVRLLLGDGERPGRDPLALWFLAPALGTSVVLWGLAARHRQRLERAERQARRRRAARG